MARALAARGGATRQVEAEADEQGLREAIEEVADDRPERTVSTPRPLVERRVRDRPGNRDHRIVSCRQYRRLCSRQEDAPLDAPAVRLLYRPPAGYNIERKPAAVKKGC